jgi:hypothetical protein
MPRKKQQPLTREGEPKQTTKSGLEIPVPTRGEFDRFLAGVKKSGPRKAAPPSRSDQGKR